MKHHGLRVDKDIKEVVTYFKDWDYRLVMPFYRVAIKEDMDTAIWFYKMYGMDILPVTTFRRMIAALKVIHKGSLSYPAISDVPLKVWGIIHREIHLKTEEHGIIREMFLNGETQSGIIQRILKRRRRNESKKKS